MEAKVRKALAYLEAVKLTIKDLESMPEFPLAGVSEDLEDLKQTLLNTIGEDD